MYLFVGRDTNDVHGLTHVGVLFEIVHVLHVQTLAANAVLELTRTLNAVHLLLVGRACFRPLIEHVVVALAWQLTHNLRTHVETQLVTVHATTYTRFLQQIIGDATAVRITTRIKLNFKVFTLY